MARREVDPATIEAAREAAAARMGVPASTVQLTRLQERRPDRPIYLASSGGVEVVTKQYLDDEFLAGSAARLAAAAPLAERIAVPRLLGVDEGRRILIMSVIRGAPLLERLAGSGDPRTVSIRAGSAIAIVHGSGIPFPGRRGRNEMVGQVGAMAVLDEDRPRFDAALGIAAGLLDAAPSAPEVPTHGDLGPDQMLDCGPTLGMLDFDKAVQAEAARDLGYFLAHLLRDLPETAAELWASFLLGYAEEAEPPQRESTDGYALLVLLRKLARATAPRTGEEQAARGDRPRVYKTANRIRPAIDRILARGAVT